MLSFVETNPSIFSIDLSNNRMSTRTIIKIAAFLSSNDTLGIVKLNKTTTLTEDSWNAIIVALANNFSLQEFELDGCFKSGTEYDESPLCVLQYNASLRFQNPFSLKFPGIIFNAEFARKYQRGMELNGINGIRHLLPIFIDFNSDSDDTDDTDEDRSEACDRYYADTLEQIKINRIQDLYTENLWTTKYYGTVLQGKISSQNIRLMQSMLAPTRFGISLLKLAIYFLSLTFINVYSKYECK